MNIRAVLKQQCICRIKTKLRAIALLVCSMEQDMEAETNKFLKPVVIASAAAVMTLLIFLPALNNEFVLWDDNIVVSENIQIRSISPEFFLWALSDIRSGLWQPVSWFSFALDHGVWGLRPIGYHLTNIVLHSVNTFLVTLLFIRLIRRSKFHHQVLPSQAKTPSVTSPLRDDMSVLIAAGAAGLLFGIHPLHVEPVAWASGRNDLLSMFFVLLSLIAYARYGSLTAREAADNPGRSLPYFASLAFFIFAVASKPTAIVLPVVLLILDWYPLGRVASVRDLRTKIIEKIPFFVITVCIALVTWFGERSIGSIDTTTETIPIRILVAVKALAAYLLKMVAPYDILPYYPYPKQVSIMSPEFFIPVLLVSAITAVSLLVARRWRLIPAAWMYYLVTMAPVIGIVKVRATFMADRYTYLSSLGPFLLLGVMLSFFWTPRAFSTRSQRIMKVVASIVSITLVLSFVAVTINQIPVWKNSVSLWSAVIEKEPERIPTAYVNRGWAFQTMKRYDKAIADYDMAIKLAPQSSALAYNNRGIAYKDLGQYDRAEQDLDTATRLQPGSALAFYNRGILFGVTKQWYKATNDLDHALALKSAYPEAYIARGAIYTELGSYELALEDFTRAIMMNPYQEDAYLNRGVVFDRMNLLARANDDYNTAIALDPGDYLAYANRGIVNKKMNSAGDAERDFSAAIALRPDVAELYIDRGDLYRDMGKRGLAEHDYRMACGLGDESGCASEKSIAKGTPR
jgi:tetratricopeptide (TPR) repeat protein